MAPNSRCCFKIPIRDRSVPATQAASLSPSAESSPPALARYWRISSNDAAYWKLSANSTLASTPSPSPSAKPGPLPRAETQRPFHQPSPDDGSQLLQLLQDAHPRRSFPATQAVRPRPGAKSSPTALERYWRFSSNDTAYWKFNAISTLASTPSPSPSAKPGPLPGAEAQRPGPLAQP